MDAIEQDDAMPKVETVGHLAQEMNRRPGEDLVAPRRIEADNHEATAAKSGDPL